MLRRLPLFIEYYLENQLERERVLPLDVLTREGAEWLKFQRQDGTIRELRLDWLVSAVE